MSLDDRQHREPWHPGSRVQRLRASHSYRLVLLLFLGIFLFIMAAPNDNGALSVLALMLTATLIVAIWTSGLGWSLPRTVILCAVGVTLAAVASAVGGDGAIGGVWLVGVLLVAAIMAVIGLGVVDSHHGARHSPGGNALT